MVYYYVIHNCRTVPLLARHVCLQDDKKLAKTTPDIIPKLIAFAPSVELLFSNRDDVHKTALNTLITAAILSGRTPALPLVPCDSPWIQHLSDDERHRRGNEDFGTVGDRNVIQFGPKTDLKCFWKAWSCRKCDQITVPWYDFQKLLEGAPKQDRFPNEGNSIAYDRMELTRRTIAHMDDRANTTTATLDQSPSQMPYEDLVGELEMLEDRKIVWIGTMVSPENASKSLSEDLRKKLDAFDKSIAICPDC